jgi:hypothetical protein
VCSFTKKKKRKEGFVMKKILLALVVLVFATPALADVNITIAQVGEPCDGRVQISYDATGETNLVRAFGLDVTLDNDANVVSATGMSVDYWVYPGTIQIAADGTITDMGTIAAEYGDLPGDTLPGPSDGNGVTLEAASLYAPVGPGSPNAPAKTGILAEIIVDANTTLCITANVSRAGATGVVMEDPDEVVTVNVVPPCLFIDVPDAVPPECLKTTDPGYNTWTQLGKGPCWCYRHQCQGDADGQAAFGRYVALSDLNILKAEFGKTILELQGMGSNGCADFDHLLAFGRPVALSDLNILKANFGVGSLPDCPMTHINNYEEP